MKTFGIKSCKIKYANGMYNTKVDICCKTDQIELSLCGNDRYVLKKIKRGNDYCFTFEMITEKFPDNIKILLKELNGREENFMLTPSKLSYINNYFRKKIYEKGQDRKQASVNAFAGKNEELYYALDHLEYLPNYNMIKITGWCVASGAFVHYGSGNTFLLGCTSYRREDVSQLYHTNDKTGFEAIYRVAEAFDAAVVGLDNQDESVEFKIGRDYFNIVEDIEEQRLKAEQYYISAPYKFENCRPYSAKKLNGTVDIILACNEKRWAENFILDFSDLEEVRFVIAVNEEQKSEFEDLQREYEKIRIVYGNRNTKEELKYLALQTAQAEYCIFAEQEDMIDKNYLSAMVDCFSDDVKLVCANYDLVYNGKHVARIVRSYESWIAENPELFLLSSVIKTDYIKHEKSYTDIVNRIKACKKEQVFFADGNYIGYHYNCVEDSWGDDTHIKNIAFYLTQYHENEENNRWWGKGFTEWTNVKRAKPMFKGHHQPRVPGELGYYDLVEDNTIMTKQTELAREHGINGFCFYYYWFKGKRLLRKPLDLFIENKDIDFDYCICWANESWTRRWDGLEQEILMEQLHNEQTDVEFIYDVIPMFRDKRYIRIDGKPLLLIYRMELFPKPAETIERWRQMCRKEHIGEIHVSIVQSFAQVFPQKYGADSATEFPPHKVNMAPNVCVNGDVSDKAPEFEGNLYSYAELVSNLSNIVMRDYELMQGSMLEWDNTARRKNNSNIFCEFCPEAFKFWNIKNRFYTRLYNYDKANCIFVNAWNEWAEGSYLEPDEKYGRAMLESISEVSKMK